MISTPPNITLGSFQSFAPEKSALLGEKKLPADSCKQIHDASLASNKPRAKNGVYWIKTDLQGSSSVQTYCDMRNGCWTLVGKISGNVGNIYDKWLVSKHNTASLKSPKITGQKQFACFDAHSLAVDESSTILLSSSERMDGLGSKWVMWRLPGGREKDSFLALFCWTISCKGSRTDTRHGVRLEWKQKGNSIDDKNSPFLCRKYAALGVQGDWKGPSPPLP